MGNFTLPWVILAYLEGNSQSPEKPVNKGKSTVSSAFFDVSHGGIEQAWKQPINPVFTGFSDFRG